MSKANETQADLPQAVARRFEALWQLLDPAASGDQSELRRTMLDQVRNALDRVSGRMDADGEMAEFVANTFARESIISQNAMSEVLLVRHRDLGTLHALKQPRASHANDPIATAMIMREARLMLSLNHPCIVRAETVLRLPGGRPALLMKQCGPSLATEVSDGSLTPDDIVNILICLFRALSYLHQLGLVHGDVSPANMLRGEDGEAHWKLGDFGLCRPISTSLADWDIAFAATIEFASPEAIAGKRADATSDLYSVGRLLAFMLDNCPDCTGRLRQQLSEFASHLTQPDPDKRPQNAEECLSHIANLQSA